MKNNSKIKEIATQVIRSLSEHGIVIQRYDAYSTYSIYLKFDYGVCNTLRISDHSGKQNLQYRYNIIIGGEKTIDEDKYMRYYFNEDTVQDLIDMVLFDRMVKIRKYGEQNYRSFMQNNLTANKNKKGFWDQAYLVTPER